MSNSNQFEESWKRVKQLTGWEKSKELADFLGISGSSVSGTKGRGNFPLEWAYKIAKDFKGNIEWILDGAGPMRFAAEEFSRSIDEIKTESSPQVCTAECTTEASGHIFIPQWNNPDPEAFDYVPMADAKLSAGGGCFVISENIEGYYAFRKSWLSRVATSVKNLVLMRVHGRSMDPTIQDDDTVMIDTGRRDIREGMIYALRVDSTIMIKRLSFRTGGKVLVISDNRQEYEPYEAAIKELFIIGQIIFFSRTFVPD